MKANPYLVVLDFDGNLAQTFDPSPNGIDVGTAYQRAVESIFGKMGLKIYQEIGGLQNRAPMELVVAILEAGDEENLTRIASKYYYDHHNQLNGLVSSEKAPAITWQTWDPVGAMTEILVRCKLFHLISEIGTNLPDGNKWPLPCPGALDFFKVIQNLQQGQGIDIKAAIISSGHDAFIRKTFEKAWKLPCPPILVTDDDMRGIKYRIAPKETVKPSVTLFSLVHWMWFISQFGPMFDNLQLIGFATKNRKRMMYFGDDPVKDGRLAEAAEVPFGWFVPKDTDEEPNINCQVVKFSDWRIIAEHLSKTQTVELLKNGRPFSEIIAPLCN